MGVRQSLISLVLGSLITAVLLSVFPVWLGWPFSVLGLGLFSERLQQMVDIDLTWSIVGSFLPLYYVVL